MLYLNTHIAETTAQQLSQLIGLLPLQRREAALRFTHLQGRRECVLAYMELCRGLKAEYGIDEMPRFDYTPEGKPLLADHPHIHFSLSHCREAVGCLLSDRPCGLDIERIRPVKDSLVRHTMNADECRKIFASERPDAAFIRLWTRKEAVLKLRGTGIANHLRDAIDPEQLHGVSLHTEEFPGFVVTCAYSD